MHTDETDGSQPVLKITGEALPSVSEISLLNDRTSPSLGRTNKAEMVWRPDHFPTVVVPRSPLPERAEKEKCADSYGGVVLNREN